MQRKPGFPVANCSIKMPDSMPVLETVPNEDEREQIQKRQQLINFGHSQWGFNNWSWSVTKQELDFVDFSNGKFCAGVVAFVSVAVKSFDISRENIGYATSMAPHKGSAIYKSRKCAVTNALRETLLSFGGGVAADLMELLESGARAPATPPPAARAPATPPPAARAPLELLPENNQNIHNKPPEPKNSTLNKNLRKDSVDSTSPANVIRSPHPTIKNAVVPNPPAPPPPVAKAHPIPVNVAPASRPPLPANTTRPPAPPVPTPHIRPNSNDLKPLGPPAPPAPPAPLGPPLEPAPASEQAARAERKRRQRLAQEEFRLKQLMKHPHPGRDDKADLHKSSGSFDHLLMNIPSQDIQIEETGEGAEGAEGGKRRSPSPAPEGSAKRRSVVNRLDIVTD